MACVLLIEDDEDSRDALVEALADAGIETRVAVDGLAAIRELEQPEAPSLVLVDSRMPRMGGAEFLDWLGQRPEHDHIPVILTSGDQRPVPHPRAAAVLRKPFDLEALLALVGRLCGR